MMKTPKLSITAGKSVIKSPRCSTPHRKSPIISSKLISRTPISRRKSSKFTSKTFSESNINISKVTPNLSSPLRIQRHTVSSSSKCRPKIAAKRQLKSHFQSVTPDNKDKRENKVQKKVIDVGKIHREEKYSPVCKKELKICSENTSSFSPSVASSVDKIENISFMSKHNDSVSNSDSDSSKIRTSLLNSNEKTSQATNSESNVKNEFKPVTDVEQTKTWSRFRMDIAYHVLDAFLDTQNPFSLWN